MWSVFSTESGSLLDLFRTVCEPLDGGRSTHDYQHAELTKKKINLQIVNSYGKF